MHLPKQILIPTDFSDGAKLAMEYGVELATAIGAKVHLLHAYMLPAFPFTEGQAIASQVADEWYRDAEQRLKRLSDAYRPSGVLGQVLLKLGDARPLIVELARDLNIELIVMGTHGRRGLSRLFLGSVAEAVVRTAPCPVLTVPGLSEAKTHG